MGNKSIARVGMFSAFAAMLQLSAGFIPGIGHILSVFSTLPLIMAGLKGWKYSIFVFITTNMLILFIQPAEIPIFLFTTGLLGLVLSFTLNYNYTTLLSTLMSATSLLFGMFILSTVFSIPVLGGITIQYSLVYKLIIYFLFSVIYSLIWVLSLKIFIDNVRGKL